MDTTADMIRVLGTRAADFSDDDPLLAAMGATLPKGDAVLDPARMAKTSGFPLSTKMMLALTPHRVIVYRTGWGSKVGKPLGTVPQNRLDNVEVTWNRKLAVVAIGLHDGSPVVMHPTDPETAEHFRNKFLRLRGRI